MKIYHTETQADYDALMVELESNGCKWAGIGTPDLERISWRRHEKETCIRVINDVMRINHLNYYKKEYPAILIQQYKAEENKMKFNKESVITKIDEWADDKKTSLNELKANIRRMEEDEKVVVPKFVAEWIELNRSEGVQLSRLLACYREIRDNSSNRLSKTDDAGDWFVKNPYKFVRAYEDGYTIEPEQLYVIPLENLVTSDGVQQYLSYDATGENYFASRPRVELKQEYTKDELQDVPEGYKAFAVPVEVEK